MGKIDNNKFGDKLLKVRKAAMLSRAQLCEMLRKKGFDVKSYTLCKWETGVSNPTVEAFLAICDICKVTDIRQAFVGKRLLRLYDISVSAGVGNYLENSDYEVIEVDDLVPDNADFAVRVKGDSMMPRFVESQIIFIHEQVDLEQGEIGIFLVNDEVYLKKLGKGSLISLNSSYAPIIINEYDDFRVLGKVVG